MGAELIIAGGMGVRAQDTFAENDVQVVVGAPVTSPASIVAESLDSNCFACGQIMPMVWA